MSADQIAEIAPAIREAIDGGPDICSTFTVVGKPDAWVQFVGGVANAAYPRTDDPSMILASLGSAALESWAPGEFLTVKLDTGDVPSIAAWIDRYFEQVLNAGSGYALDVSIESM